MLVVEKPTTVKPSLAGSNSEKITPQTWPYGFVTSTPEASFTIGVCLPSCWYIQAVAVGEGGERTEGGDAGGRGLARLTAVVEEGLHLLTLPVQFPSIWIAQSIRRLRRPLIYANGDLNLPVQIFDPRRRGRACAARDVRASAPPSTPFAAASSGATGMRAPMRSWLVVPLRRQSRTTDGKYCLHVCR